MPINEFDFEKFDQEWEQSNSEPEVEEVKEVEETEIESETVEVKEVETESSQQQQQDDEEIPPAVQETDEQKRNAAFAQIRRERDEAKKLADFLQRIADENGTSVDDMMKNYEQARLQEQAEQQNVPVEVLQRLQQLENENKEIKNQSFTQRFNNEVTQTMEKYKADIKDIEATMAYAAQNGLVESLQTGAVSFDAVHRMAHLDTIIEKQVQNALQENLTQKKKRQQEAPLSQGSVGTPPSETLEDMAIRDAKEILAGW